MFELVDKIIWEPVVEAIAAEDPDDVVEVTEAVDRSARRWLTYDYKRMDSVEGIEELIESPEVDERRDAKGVIDFWGWYDRRVQIIDWKTVRTLDDKWVTREERSSQALWYASLLVAAKRVRLNENTVFDVEFRGVQNPDAKTLKAARQTLGFGDLMDFEADLAKSEEWFAILDRDWAWPWPKYESGCRPFGPNYPCQHEDICFGSVQAPTCNEKPTKKSSFSTMKELARCPERLRLNVLRGIEDPIPTEQSEASRFGKAFHAGIAEVYQQTFFPKETQ